MEALNLNTQFSGTQIIDGNNYLLQKFNMEPGRSVVRDLLEEINRCQTPPIFVFDGIGGNDRRKAFYPNYKLRSEKDLAYKSASYPTLELFRSMIAFTQAITIRVHGWEADDVIASVARSKAKQNKQVYIVSTDRDLSQLAVDPFITVAYEKQGVPPALIRLFKTFTGDASDKIPGIPRFGPKAWQWLNHGLCQSVLETNGDFARYDTIMLGFKPSVYEWLCANQKLVHTFWHITGLFDVPDEEVVSNISVGLSDWSKAEAILREYML